MTLGKPGTTGGSRRVASRRRVTTSAAAVLAVTAIAATTAGGATGAGAHRSAYVVTSASTVATIGAIRDAGGTVLSQLPLVDGAVAELTAAEARDLAGNRSVTLTPDFSMHVLDAGYGGPALSAPLQRMDMGTTWSAGAGAGVGVALIDTGVADTPGINAGQVVRSPDFSGSGDGYDGYGHGTFMAGLIAGNGSAGPGAAPGSAPGATLVSVKVAGRDGSTTLAQILEGIGWAIDNQQVYDIRVMSLSFGAQVSLPPQANPIDRAVEAAEAAGITVVAAAGNSGAAGVTSPGDDPSVITVGAETTTGDVAAPSWSGFSDSKPDVLAPGVSVVSLRSPGSTIDVANPGARVGDNYFVGSGTSMSTALAAGAAAVLIADHPSATPAQVKSALLATDGPALSGPAGPVDVQAADSPAAWTAPSGSAHPLPQGSGALKAAAPTPASMRWDSMRWDSMRWDSMRWDSMRWDSMRWDSMRWDSMRWDGSAWSSSAWGQ